jgi:hypothetical protein
MLAVLIFIKCTFLSHTVLLCPVEFLQHVAIISVKTINRLAFVMKIGDIYCM